MKIGAHGCAWVRWGAGGMTNAKTRQAGVIQGLTDQDHEPMAGEISPDIMFCEIGTKVPRVGVDGCRSVGVGANRCASKGESKN